MRSSKLMQLESHAIVSIEKMVTVSFPCFTSQSATSLNQHLDPNSTEANGQADTDFVELQLKLLEEAKLQPSWLSKVVDNDG